MAYGAVFKAKASTNYEKVLWATGLSNVFVIGLRVDVNQANRVSSLTTRSVGIYLDTMTDSKVIACTVENAIGYTAIPGFGIAVAGASVRSSVDNSTAKNCGIVGKEADGIFVGGTQCFINNGTALNCLDTGLVIASSNQSGINGGTTRGCSVVFAIVNETNAVCSGNFAIGVTGYDWNASVTGGIQIGCPVAAATGDLLNTTLTGIQIERAAGAGPALNLRRTGSAKIKGVTINGMRIKGAGTQCVLINAEDVEVNGGQFEGSASGNAAVQIVSGSARIHFKTPTISGVFNFGIYSDGASDVHVITPIIKGDGVNSTHGIYFAGTATGCKVKLPDIQSITIAQIGADAGTVPDIVYEDSVTVLAYSASMTPNMISGEHFAISATNGAAFTINTPANAVAGRRLGLKIANVSGGALGAATWNAVFKLSAWTNPATGFSRSIQFRYNGTNWIQESQTGVDVPN
jgi:hypothetical protein